MSVPPKSQRDLVFGLAESAAAMATDYLNQLGYAESNWLEAGLHFSVHVVDKSSVGDPSVGLHIVLFELGESAAQTSTRMASASVFIDYSCARIYVSGYKMEDECLIDPVDAPIRYTSIVKSTIDWLRVRHTDTVFTHSVKRAP